MHKIGRLYLGYHACTRILLRCKKIICTRKCSKGSECQNQAGQVAKLIQGTSKRDRKPENHQLYVFACKVTVTAQILKVLSLISSSCMPFVQIWIGSQLLIWISLIGCYHELRIIM